VRANRSRSELQALIGPVFDYLPLRVAVGGDPTFVELVGRVRDEVAAASCHAEPVGRIQRAVDAAAPLIDVCVNVIGERNGTPQRAATAGGDTVELASAGLTVDWRRFGVDRRFYGAEPLGFVLRRSARGLGVLVVASAAAFAAPVIERYGAAYTGTLALVSRAPQLRVSHILREAQWP